MVVVAVAALSTRGWCKTYTTTANRIRIQTTIMRGCLVLLVLRLVLLVLLVLLPHKMLGRLQEQAKVNLLKEGNNRGPIHMSLTLTLRKEVM
jgi:hypothetical protein